MTGGREVGTLAVSTMAVHVKREAGWRVNAGRARGIAELYLLDHVGDLLGAGEPGVYEDGLWSFPIELSNARRGVLGDVGTIRVDARTGQVLFTEDERAQVEARAREMARAASP